MPVPNTSTQFGRDLAIVLAAHNALDSLEVLQQVCETLPSCDPLRDDGESAVREARRSLENIQAMLTGSKP